jgi:hypothetical protein
MNMLPAPNEPIAVPGMRLGRRPATFRAALNIGNYLTSAVPERPATADHITSVPQWNLGANNKWSTCGPTACANFVTLSYKFLQGLDVIVADEDIFALYRLAGNPLFNPATGADDRGVDMNQLMDAFLLNGLMATLAPTGARFLVKPLATAVLPAHDIPNVQAATALFGGVIFGMNMQIAQQRQQTWDTVFGSAAWGGHAVLGAAYTGTASDDEAVVSWAKRYGTTDNFISQQAEEAFVAILPITLTSPDFVAGVDLAQLGSDWTQFTGLPFPSAV